MNFRLGAPLLSKVSYQPAKYTHVRPEVTVQQLEYRFKKVSDLPILVMVAQPYYYTAPVVHPLLSPMNFRLGAPLLSKVSYQPAKYTHVRPEVTVQQPEYTYKSLPVPVPVAQPYYTAPVFRNFVAARQFPAYPGFGGFPLGYY